MSSSSSSRSNSGDGIVTVDLLNHPFNEPLGMLLAPGAGGGGAASAASESATAAIANRSSSPTTSNVILVAGWEHDGPRRRNNGNKRRQQQRLGPIQRSGLVRLGDRLVRINNVDVTNWTFREGMDALKELVTTTTTTTTTGTTTSNRKRVKLKSLGFAQVGTFEYWKNVHYANNNHASSPSMTRQQQQPSSSSTSSFHNLVNGDIQHNPYLQAAVAAERLKIIQRRRYKFTSYIGQWKAFVDDDNDHENKKNNVHVIKYEIKCHILFTNPPSTLTGSSNRHNIVNNDGTSNNSGSSVPRTTTWSVYKRYSELRTLDDELRALFGWQMNDANNQGGICFPSGHELETYWYNLVGGGGGGGGIGGMYSKLGSLMPSLPRICKSSQLITRQQQRRVPTTTTTMSTSGGESSSSVHYNDDTDNPECAANAAAAAATTNNNSDNRNSPCPIPTSFINRRQSELTTYWSALMCVEDIFDFSNLQFGLLMTKFLQVDEEILRTIKVGRGGAIASTTAAATTTAAAATTNAKQMMLLKAKCPLFPAINEDEESGIDINIETTTTTSPEDDNVPPPLSVPYCASTTDQQEEVTSVGLISSLTFTREQSGNIMIDDDVSALSDGTGAAIIKKSDVDDLSHTLDVAPAVVAPQTTHHNDDNLASSTTLVAVVEEEGGNVRKSSSTSVTSSSVRSRGSSNSKRNVGTQPPRAKPAFQRQFL